MGFFDLPFIAKIRRNHGLEHATIHILSEKHKRLSMVGRSDWGGFTLYGTIDTADVQSAVEEALHRMRRGESHLAVHPRCGTVLATTGFATGLAAFLAIGIDSRTCDRFRWATLPTALLAATGAAIVAQPLGLYFQEQYTTSGYPANLEIKRITLQPNTKMVIHRVETAQ
ncbi:DUF6391 domain-containing protein [Anaerolineales bacterium HSG6]|nr:DUF6391 domain-containing protein [Anaerolineales bacterium HSG6]MDM8530635.1 DUF6391 domain-containing protein [Anaerolineales bacterium HSG25]